MSTLAASAPVVKTTTLEIKGASYSATPIDPGFAGVAAVRMTKLASGATYDLALTLDGRVECNCPDYTVRHADRGTLCKHGRAALAAGLLPPPVSGGSPVAELPPAVHAPAPAPVTPADRKRARYFGLTIPAVAPGPVAAPRAASDDESSIDLSGFSDRISIVGGEMVVESGPAEMTAAEFRGFLAAHNGDAGGPPMGWVKLGAVSVLANLTPRRIDFARGDRIQIDADATVARVRAELDRPTRRGRFVPTPDDHAAAAALFADHGFSADSPAPPPGDRSWPKHVAPPSRSFSANHLTDRHVHRRGVS